MRRRLLVPLRRKSPGQILVLAALLMVPLLGATGLAVDLGNAYLQTRILQTAADAAALNGMRVMAGGVPGQTFGTFEVQTAIANLVGTNAPGATVAAQDLIWGSTPNADQCLSSGVTQRKALASATSVDLWTAPCLQVTAQETVSTFFVQVVGVPSYTLHATATAAAAPVLAMYGLRPITVPESAVVVNGRPTSAWGPGWDSSISTKPCAQWTGAPVPHALGPTPACAGGTDMSSYGGLVNLLGPPSPPTQYAASDATGCHYDSHFPPSGEPAGRMVGWDNPTHSHCCGIPWTGSWANTSFTQDPVYTNCSNPAAVDNAVGSFAQNGYQGIISVGDAGGGEGDFFTLDSGDVEANFHAPLDRACVPPSLTIYLPVFDAVADPNHNGQVAVHMRSLAALQVSCPLPPPSSSITGTFVQSPVPLGLARRTGSSRQQGAANVTVVKLVG